MLYLKQGKLEVGKILSFQEEKQNYSETEWFVQCPISVKSMLNSNSISHVLWLHLFLIVLQCLPSLMDLALEMCQLESETRRGHILNPMVKRDMSNTGIFKWENHISCDNTAFRFHGLSVHHSGMLAQSYVLIYVFLVCVCDFIKLNVRQYEICLILIHSLCIYTSVYNMCLVSVLRAVFRQTVKGHLELAVQLYIF